MLASTHTAEINLDGAILPVLDYCLEQAVDQIDSLFVTIDAARDLTVKSPAEYLHKPVIFTLEEEETKDARYFHGLVWKAEFKDGEDGDRQLSLVVYPELMNLCHRSDCRIFMDMTLEQITSEVLKLAAVTNPVRWELSDQAEKLKYCVQYDETDYEFLSRILARDGISWWSEETKASACLIFCDAVAKYSQDAAKELPFINHMGGEIARAAVSHLERGISVVPNGVQVSGFDPHHPSLKIEERKTGTEQNAGDREIYFPLTSRASSARAARVAKLTLESYQSRRDSIYAHTADHLLSIGQHIHVSNHPYSPMNQEYLIVKLRHAEIRYAEFSSSKASAKKNIEIWGVPVENGYAPVRQATSSRILGLQTAITTGDPGEDINTNEHGETTVHFHWDRLRPMNGTSSRMMRTAQLPTGGSMLLPRVGWEVTVSHYEGDPDEPLVISRLYNGATMPPYSLPENALRSSIQTNTTPGDGSSNEIRMSDVKGEEQMFFNASKDMSVDVGNNTTQSIGNDHKIKVGANHSITVIDSYKSTIGANQSVTISGNRSQNITSLAVDDVKGNHEQTVGGNLTQMIGGDLRRTLKAKSELEVGGNCLTATIGSVSVDIGAGFDHKVDAACVEIVKGSRSMMIGTSKSEQTNGAKLILTQSVRAVEAGVLNTTIGGAMMVKADGNRTLSAKTAFVETAGGMEKLEAANITIEGQASVSITMGGAMIAMTPASISVTGANVTVDGDLVQVSPMNINN